MQIEFHCDFQHPESFFPISRHFAGDVISIVTFTYRKWHEGLLFPIFQPSLPLSLPYSHGRCIIRNGILCFFLSTMLNCNWKFWVFFFDRSVWQAMANPYRVGQPDGATTNTAMPNGNAVVHSASPQRHARSLRNGKRQSRSPGRASSMRYNSPQHYGSNNKVAAATGAFHDDHNTLLVHQGSSRRLSASLTRTSSLSPSRCPPPTVMNPEGRGRKLPATPIRKTLSLSLNFSTQNTSSFAIKKAGLTLPTN